MPSCVRRTRASWWSGKRGSSRTELHPGAVPEIVPVPSPTVTPAPAAPAPLPRPLPQVRPEVPGAVDRASVAPLVAPTSNPSTSNHSTSNPSRPRRAGADGCSATRGPGPEEGQNAGAREATERPARQGQIRLRQLGDLKAAQGGQVQPSAASPSDVPSAGPGPKAESNGERPVSPQRAARTYRDRRGSSGWCRSR